MDLTLSPETSRFATRSGAFSPTTCRPRHAPRHRSDHRASSSIRTSRSHFIARSHRKGWSVPHWPVEHGGTGWTPVQRYIFDSNAAAPVRRCTTRRVAFRRPRHHPLRHAGAEGQVPAAYPFRRGLLGAGLFRARLGLRSRVAEDAGPMPDGDHYVVNGQKIWTTNAHQVEPDVRAGAHLHRRQAPGRHHLPAVRHGHARDHRPPHHRQRRRSRIQRSVLRRRAGADVEPRSARRTRAGRSPSTCWNSSAAAGCWPARCARSLPSSCS